MSKRNILDREVKMNLEDNIFVLYSASHNFYYLEDASPGAWKTSIETWDTFEDAEDAYYEKEFGWT